MENILNNFQSDKQDQQNDNYYICTTPNCQYRGLILQSSIQSTHKNCDVVQYQKFVDSIKNYNEKYFSQETFQNYDLQLKKYIRKVDRLSSFLNGQSLIFKNIKNEFKVACDQKNKQKITIQQFEDNYSKQNFELVEPIFQQSRIHQQQPILHQLDKNINKITINLEEIQKKLKNFDIESIEQNELSDDDDSSDEDSSDDDCDQIIRIQNQQQDPEVQELENKYNQAFNFLRNKDLNQSLQNNEELQPQLLQQYQSQQYEEQTKIKYIEKFGNNLIVVATKNQIRIYDLISKSFQPKIHQINAIITSLQVTKLESIIVVGKKDGNMEVLEYEDTKRKNNFTSRIFRVSEEEGRLFIEKLEPRQSHSDIACLGRDTQVKIYNTTNFDLKKCFYLNYGSKIIPTCLFITSENQYIIGAEKSLFFNQTKITHVFKRKIKQICKFGNCWLISDKIGIYILKQHEEFFSDLKKIEKEFHFTKKIQYLTTFYDSQYIFINTKSTKSDNYENEIATIQESKDQIDIQFEKLDKNIQIKLLKGYQNKNETLLYGIDGFNITEYKMIKENDKFLIL